MSVEGHAAFLTDGGGHIRLFGPVASIGLALTAPLAGELTIHGVGGDPWVIPAGALGYVGAPDTRISIGSVFYSFADDTDCGQAILFWRF